ncbi:MAG: HutD family protein [Gemmatimonadaceae bacterium]|nr:HutD family protein [Gemmatimonadaceae bacterium]
MCAPLHSMLSPDDPDPRVRPLIHTVQLGDVTPQPWKNGGGSTRELLAWPAADSWLLRVSVAHIGRDGPFSAFPGVDRWFAVLEGAGVALTLGTDQVQLTGESQPLAFDGALAPDCTLTSGDTHDLNLMVLRVRAQGAMTRAVIGVERRAASRIRAVYTQEPAELHSADAAPLALPAGTLAWSSNARGVVWRLEAGDPAARAWWIEVQPREETP